MSPTLKESKKGIRRAALIVAMSIGLAALLPLGGWTVAMILVTVAALLSVGFDLRRILTKKLLLSKIQFDDCRIERVCLHQPEGKEVTINVVAFDATGHVDIEKGSVAFFERGTDVISELFDLNEFANGDMVNLLVDRLRAREIVVNYKDDDLHLPKGDLPSNP